MQDYQRDFLRFALDLGVLKFGDFTLKSGRQSPYFFNAGLFNTGSALARLGGFYAAALQASGLACDVIYGPAYKGIPLAAATAIALASQHGRDLPYAFNRKESKDHGEGGIIVGHPLRGQVLIIDDVITAGTSVRESIELIKAAGATPCGVTIALDRQEKATANGQDAAESAVQQVEQHYGLPVVAIATLGDLLRYLETQSDPALTAFHPAVLAYRQRYGV